MNESILPRLFEHNNWANQAMIAACAALSDEQLDSPPPAGSSWTIRQVLIHLVGAQRGYLLLLTLPVSERRRDPLSFAELGESAGTSGAGLLALARIQPASAGTTRIQTTDGYLVEAWVVMLQVINHATEHRRQLSGMLRALGVTPPNLDGWSYGETTGAVVQISA